MTYALWTLVNAGTLVATYFVDPYVFAFSHLGLAGATGGIGLLGVGVCIRVKALDASTKAMILAAIALAAAFHVAAFAVLKTFNWA